MDCLASVLPGFPSFSVILVLILLFVDVLHVRFQFLKTELINLAIYQLQTATSCNTILVAF